MKIVDGLSMFLGFFIMSVITIGLFLFLSNGEMKTQEKENLARFNSDLFEEHEGATYIDILTDKETGCEYLVHGGSKFESGVTVLLDKNGKPSGCDSVN